MNSLEENSHTFINLPKYDENGNEITYSVKEIMESKFYTSRIEGNTIINTYVDEEGKIEVIIQKVDKETKVGIAGATITLIGEQETKAVTDNEGYAVFEVEKGKEYSYKEEIAPNGYEINTNTYRFKVTENGIIEDIEGNRIIEDEKIKAKPVEPEEPVNPVKPEKPDNLSPSLPKTGENNIVVLVLLAMISATSVTGVYFYKKKTNNHGIF